MQMDDSQGPLECYATRQPTVKTDEHNGEGPAEPAQVRALDHQHYAQNQAALI